MNKVFCIYDSKAEAYLQPFFMKTVGEAERAVADLVNQSDHHFNKHSGDFTLFELGSWDEFKARFDLLSTPHSIGVLCEYKRGDN